MNIKYIIIFIIIMKNYILIDGSYFVFYRVFALQIWWKNAKPDIPLENPFTNEEFVEKFKSTFTSKIIELQKKFKIKDAVILVGKDCRQSDIWRMDLHSQYKAGRNDEKNKEANISQFFELVYNENLFEKAGASKIIAMDSLEADDCLALTAQYLYHKYEDANITIITSDHDYIQLSNERIYLFNLKYKSLLESKAYSGSPERDLFYKIILGDKSDNIKPVFNKCGKKTVEKCFDDNNYFINKLQAEDKQEIYELNKKLIDFNEIPIPLIKLFYSSILSSL